MTLPSGQLNLLTDVPDTLRDEPALGGEARRPSGIGLAGEGLTPSAGATIDLRVPRARTTDPQTSHEAARTALHGSETHLRLLALLEIHGPLTDPELWDAYRDHYGPISDSGCRTRRQELVEDGRVAAHDTVKPPGRRSSLTRWSVTG